MVQSSSKTNPFPGLRPFELDEEHLFFGREGQADDLLTRLNRTRFLAVVGTSGSGKSSLVRAGLLPSLYSGLMQNASSGWRVAILRPGSAPMANLAAALNAPEVFGVDPASDDAIIRTALTESTLRRGALGLVEVAQQARMEPYENLLVVVDQFEELFRFKAQAQGQDRRLAAEDEAAAFVKLLLGAVNQREVPIFVVLTMRSDFLGDCAQFRDLPETLNDGQYLIPRLTREQLRSAIEGPVAVGGVTITTRLVNRLLNEAGDNPYQLPILQHALMRTWDYWEDRHTPQAPIDMELYEATGGIAQALSRHVEQVYEGLPDDRSRQIARTLFKRLTDRGVDNRDIRRPTQLGEICAAADASEAEVIGIIDQFRAPRRSFLMPPATVPLYDSTVIDISHESLMRNWQRLKQWVNEETQSAQIYKRLAETAELYEKGEARYWRVPELTIGLTWQEEQKPNQVWADRYASNFGQAIGFLEASAKAAETEAAEKEKKHKREVNRLRTFLALLGGLSLLTGGAAVYAFSQQQEAKNQAQIAEVNAQTATEQRQIADEQREAAENSRQEAYEQRDIATLAVGAILGLLLRSGLTFALETQKDVLYTAKDLKRVTPAPILGLIPYNEVVKRGYNESHLLKLYQPDATTSNSSTRSHLQNGSVPPNDMHAFKEAFRFLVLNLQGIDSEKPLRSLVISSTDDQVADSTTAAYLAWAAAEMGNRVLLIDADFRFPHLHNFLELPNQKGFSNILEGELDLKHVIKRSSIEPNLFVLTAGTSDVDPARLVASSKIPQFMAKTEAYFDLIIYDAPSCSDYADAALLSAEASGLVLVLQLGTVKSAQFEQTLEKHWISKVPLIGLIAKEAASKMALLPIG